MRIRYENGREYIAIVKYFSDSDTHIITYKGDFRKEKFLKKIAPLVVRILGKNCVLKADDLSSKMKFFFAAFILFLLTYLLVKYGVADFYVLFTISAFLFFQLGLRFSSVANYYRNTFCEVCGKEFAYEESEKPDVKEVSTPEDYSFEITRYWKCKYCGQKKVRTLTEDFVAKKGLKMSLSQVAKLPCKKCGKNVMYEEYKKPDLRERKCITSNSEIATTRRYFICKHCGYKDIVSKEVTTTFVDYYTISVEKITYEDYLYSKN